MQKTGGSSLCGTFVRSYARTTKHAIRHNYPWTANCNDQEMSTSIITNPHTYLTNYRPYGKYFVAIEPSYSVHNTWTWVDPNDFPFKYHDQPSTKLLLDPTHASTDSAWNAGVHFIAVRHPLQLAISALNYAFQPDRDTILDRCDAFNMTLNACLLAVIQIADQPVPSPALSSIYQRYQDEKNKASWEKNTAKYEQDQLHFAHAVPKSPMLSQPLPTDYWVALATADAALRDISTYRDLLMQLVQEKNLIESNGRNRGALTTDSFNNYILYRLSRKNNATAAATATATAAANPSTTASTTTTTVESTPPTKNRNERLFSIWQEHRIRYQVLGNYSIHHLSLNNNVETAKLILRKFSLIVDLSLGDASEVSGHYVAWDDLIFVVANYQPITMG